MSNNTPFQTMDTVDKAQAGPLGACENAGTSRRPGRVLLDLLAVVAVLALVGIRPTAAQSDQDNTDHTGWSWLKKQTASSLTSYITDNSARITDLQVVNGAFDAVVVSNSGSYAKTWWWYYGLTPSQALSKAKTNHGRIIAVSPYISGGKLYVAVVMISNTGQDAAGWSFYSGSNPATLIQAIESAGQRVIQFKPYGITSSGTTGYVAVGVANDTRQSAVLVQSTKAQISKWGDKGYRVVEMAADFGGKITAVLDTESVVWYWYINVTSDFLWGAASYDSVRPISIAPDGSNWMAALIAN